MHRVVRPKVTANNFCHQSTVTTIWRQYKFNLIVINNFCHQSTITTISNGCNGRLIHLQANKELALNSPCCIFYRVTLL